MPEITSRRRGGYIVFLSAFITGAVVISGVARSDAAVTGTTVFDQTYFSDFALEVEPGLTSMEVTLIGGSGGGATNNNANPALSTTGGRGAQVNGALPVTPGQTLFLRVGGNGTDSASGSGGTGAGGANGGGAGGQQSDMYGFLNSGAGGGGASDVRTVNPEETGSLGSRLVVAGGGGGAGRPLNQSTTSNGGNAGDAGLAGTGTTGGTSTFGNGGGSGGTQSAGGAAGTGSGNPGTAGEQGYGGTGGAGKPSNPSGGAGGGGGGYFGGGGGRGGGNPSVSSSNGGGGGGGGGSSLTPAGFSANLAQAGATPSIRIQYTIPETEIESAPAGPTNDNTPTFAFDSSEAGSTFTCRVDAAALVACTSPFTVTTPLGDGAHTVGVRATNSDGNFDPTPDGESFTIDTAAPETTISSGPADVTDDSTPTFGFTSSESASSFRCSLDGASFVACSGTSLKTAPLSDGAHEFAVAATDSAGNGDATPARSRFTVNTAVARPPVVAKVALGGTMRNTRKGTTVLTVAVSGPGTVTVSGKAITKVTKPAKAAGKVQLLIKPTARTLTKLRSTPRGLKVPVLAAFAPTGGSLVTASGKVGLLVEPVGR